MSGSSTEPLTLREYEWLPYEGFTESEVSRLEGVTDGAGRPVFRCLRTRFQARQYVGMVKVGDRVVQVLPKIYDGDDENLGFLVFMLSYTRRLRLQPTGTADYEKLGGSFLEVWIRHFATELNRLLRRHLVHRYVEVEERAGFLRGKLLTERELDGAGEMYARYACCYEVFTPDHLLNRTLKFCNALLLRQTRVTKTRTLLQENDTLLADVAHGPIRPHDLDLIHLDRLDRHYEPILGLCRLLLESSTLDFRSGRITQLAFVFDMNALFEEFVAEFLKRNVGKMALGGGRRLARVRYQHRVGKLFGEFEMRPDLVLTDDAGDSFLVDTKYKTLDIAQRHGGLSQADFYQMYAYGKAGERSYADVILLYPATTRVQPTFHHGALRLHVRQFDPRKLYDPKKGALNEDAATRELTEAFAGVQYGSPLVPGLSETATVEARS